MTQMWKPISVFSYEHGDDLIYFYICFSGILNRTICGLHLNRSYFENLSYLN